MRIIRVIISLLLMITVIVVTSMPILADANTENTSLDTAENAEKKLLSNGVFSYYIDNGFAVIEKCIDEASTVIIIPDRIGKFKVASINEAAFSYCLKLKGFVSQNDRFNVIDGILYSKDTLLCYPPAKSRKAFIIPPHITEISGRAFTYNNSLEYIYIQRSLCGLLGSKDSRIARRYGKNFRSRIRILFLFTKYRIARFGKHHR